MDVLWVGSGGEARRVAVMNRAGSGPGIVWFGGFRSEMTGTKADRLDAWAAETGRPFLRFDYSGHGRSGGRSEEGTISRWLEDALAAIDAHATPDPVFVGSSMGGWLALLATRALRRRAAERGGEPRAPAALVLLAPAPDFTERLMWDAFPPQIRDEIATRGVYLQPSEYGPEPYPITRALIEDGRHHLLLGNTLETGCPVHIIQGMEDPDVPWQHAMRLVDILPGDAVQLTMVKDGDHRLSRPEDLDRLIAAVEAATRLAEAARAASPQLRLTV